MRAEQSSYERFAPLLLETEVSARDSHGGEARIRQARFPARKTLEEFDFTFQRSVKKTVIEHLGNSTSCTPRRVHRRVGRARSWFTLHLCSHWLSKRSRPASGTSILRPLRRPLIT